MSKMHGRGTDTDKAAEAGAGRNYQGPTVEEVD